MSHGVLIKNSVNNTDNSLLRSVKCASDVDNGNVFRLIGVSTIAGEGEVWNAATPITGGLSDLWMACEPEVVVTVSGTKQFKGINPDVRDFYNVA